VDAEEVGAGQSSPSRLKPRFAKEKAMHDLDRTQNYESDYGEFEFEFDNEGEGEFGYEGESVFDEVEEMEFAAQLLEITDEAELDQFLGKLLKKAGGAARAFIKSPIGKQLGGILKGAAKSALPVVGSALGNLVVPGIGGMVGGKLASGLGDAFGLELEGLSPQDQEFEVARSFVRLAGEAAKNAASSAASTVASGGSAQQAAKNAFIKAAQKHAPGLIRPANGGQTGMNGASSQRDRTGRGQSVRSGRWIRKGDKIIVLGA
jgi:hypothetical protein